MTKYEAKCLTTQAERAALPPFSFDVFLYHQPEHVFLQTGPNWLMFVFINTQTGLVDGLGHFFSQEKVARSPWRAPFGGVQLNSNVLGESILAFLQYINQFLLEKCGAQVQWIQCPDAFAPITNQFLRTKLPTYGYALKCDQRNHHIPVTQAPFSEKVHPSLKRRLAKALHAGFVFQKEPAEALPEAYAFLKRCREEKQKPLSLSLEQLSQYFSLFPERYFIFTVRQGAELAAVGIAVLITSCILNHLYPASPRVFNSYSPSVLLNAGLYEYCQEHNIPVLDLGVSAPVNEYEDDYKGLFTFKKRLGGIESWKPTFWRPENIS